MRTACKAFLASLCLAFSLACAAQAPMNSTAAKHLVLIGASYAAEWEQPRLPGYTVTNKGIDGQESSDLRARFEKDVLALKPDTVMIWGHYNDIVRASADKMAAARQQAQDNYRAMAEQARAAGIEVPVQLAGTRMEPPPSEPSAIGPMLAATAAAAPPLEPPGV